MPAAHPATASGMWLNVDFLLLLLRDELAPVCEKVETEEDYCQMRAQGSDVFLNTLLAHAHLQAVPCFNLPPEKIKFKIRAKMPSWFYDRVSAEEQERVRDTLANMLAHTKAFPTKEDVCNRLEIC